ncbi:hypothetical protein F4819DRAFT_436380 [Hypoxylon fuscum]|nr:hypothetical protein F4819DRAFT_436380 [Hypoxylon fuscum]
MTWFRRKQADYSRRWTPPVRQSENKLEFKPVDTLWNLPGLDKTTFYAAALYLHVAAKGQLRDTEQHRRHHHSRTDGEIQDFLDRLADCFARSKSTDAQAHVSATAMVLDKQQRMIKIYVAKNLSGKNIDAHVFSPREEVNMLNEDELFARDLCTWFNKLGSGQEAKNHTKHQVLNGKMWDIMHRYNATRLEFYVRKVKDWDGIVPAELDDVWSVTHGAIRACKAFGDHPFLGPTLDDCAQIASKCRADASFQQFSQDIDRILHDDDIDAAYKGIARVAKWINYLGRLGDTYSTFFNFCRGTERQGFTYEIKVLKSPAEEEWTTNTYKQTIESWTGDLGLDDERQDRDTARTALNMFAAKSGSRGTARVHCEIQLLKYFARPGSEPCLDYIGCSKKSCWLCWQFLGHFGLYTTKDTHGMIYPMWAFPADFLPSQIQFAKALSATYKDMITLVQDKVLFGRDFSSRLNISHTSPRLNRNPSMQAISPSLIPSPSATRSLWSSASILSQGRVPIARVPVVHFPADASGSTGEIPKPHIIYVDLFEKTQSSDLEFYTQHFYIEEKKVLFAFQLNTLSNRPVEPRELTFPEVETMFWFSWELRDVENFNVRYQTMYRMEDEHLSPNPWFLDRLKQIHGSSFREEAIPWYGDVFIFAAPLDPSMENQIILEEDALKLDDCIEILIAYLSFIPYARVRDVSVEYIRGVTESMNMSGRQ